MNLAIFLSQTPLIPLGYPTNSRLIYPTFEGWPVRRLLRRCAVLQPVVSGPQRPFSGISISYDQPLFGRFGGGLFSIISYLRSFIFWNRI